MKNFLDTVVAHPAGAFVLLSTAAFLEAGTPKQVVGSSVSEVQMPWPGA